ncbi:predicted protein [Thalassiosira pseudonana CCMP1335]|uniref:Pseudouridine synthase RsuA/RluA-like domain-containing protein n=1 Tax=Thalassiosira pseudonana TaxID=35128 RepID=B8BWY4_THAPS|nr:predicted protein [Thalassiosira pseudonana CCMP1335]EED93615.1 predicted protein [Thalassiosira pseudonana CCMP1335]
MVVHRLDRDTSGVFLLARNDEALKTLHDDFKDKTRGRVTKRYVALVCGHWNSDNASCVADRMTTDEGEIDLPLVRDIENPPFMRVATTGNEIKLPVTRVELQPITGRTHQLRVHCAAMGYPIVGDSIYGYGGEGSPREGIEMDEDECLLCLHAQRLTIFHPLTKAPMMFECSPPF